MACLITAPNDHVFADGAPHLLGGGAPPRPRRGQQGKHLGAGRLRQDVLALEGLGVPHAHLGGVVALFITAVTAAAAAGAAEQRTKTCSSEYKSCKAPGKGNRCGSVLLVRAAIGLLPPPLVRMVDYRGCCCHQRECYNPSTPTLLLLLPLRLVAATLLLLAAASASRSMERHSSTVGRPVSPLLPLHCLGRVSKINTKAAARRLVAGVAVGLAVLRGACHQPAAARREAVGHLSPLCLSGAGGGGSSSSRGSKGNGQPSSPPIPRQSLSCAARR